MRILTTESKKTTALEAFIADIKMQLYCNKRFLPLEYKEPFVMNQPTVPNLFYLQLYCTQYLNTRSKYRPYNGPLKSCIPNLKYILQ